MNELSIRQKIYEIRSQRVMLDFDLADAYGVETSQLKRQVRRNMERFEGEDFMFEVTREELSRCQIGTLNVGQGHNIKYLPFASFMPLLIVEPCPPFSLSINLTVSGYFCS